MPSTTVTARRRGGGGPAPWRGAAGAVLVLLTACQPEARRALLLDLALTDPVVLSGTAAPWRDAGYTVEYRQFYPHLARADLGRYHTLLILLGGEPEAPSDALTAGDLAMLHEWVARGGVVVLGYDADGEGSLDRWTANRWLAFEGAGITIGDRLLEDTTTRPPTTTGRPQPWGEARTVGDEPLGSVYDPFPLDRNHVVGVRDRAALLAVTGRHTFVRAARGTAAQPDAGVAAAVRIGDGLVVVISRYALGALGPQFRPTTAPVLQRDALEHTHDFLSALARWTRRPAEWAHVPPAAHGVPLALAPAPTPVEVQPPPLAPPPGVAAIALPLVTPPALERATSVPDWLRQGGLRVLWAPLLVGREGHRMARSSAALDSLVALLDAGGFNLVAGDADPEGSDSVHARWEEREAVRRAWTDAATRLQPTSVAWIPVFEAAGARWTPGDSARGPRGEALPLPCAFDSTVWARALDPAYLALARLAADQRTLVIALGLDLAGGRVRGLEFCDAAWHRGLARLARSGALDSLPYAARYPLLRNTGLLARYQQALEDEVAARAAAVRDRVLRQRRDLYFAFRLAALPADWFTLGLLRGFALSDRPILLLTPELKTRAALAAYRARDVNLVHAVALVPASLRARDWSGLRHLLFEENDGFWLAADEARAGGSTAAPRLPLDSLTRFVRRLGR
ncbi:MAG TPA: hypothetical protein VH116_09250 [Gemmatimonadales bacterium]|nr:hypothetical protein [Gemmatimonadales bacterium]